MKRLIVFIATFVFLAISFKGYGQTTSKTRDLITRSSPELILELENYVPHLMSEGRVAGLQVAVIREDEAIWTKGFGFKNVENQSPNNDQTIFEAASLTKPLFGYAVMKMVDEGTIDLDSPVLDYLATEEVEAFIGHSINAEGFNKEWAGRITARHILSHSAGMPHGESGEAFPLLFEPGSGFKYSAAGYDLLQRAVEKIKNKRLDILIEEYIFIPFGMKSSSMVWKEDYQKRAVNGHDMFGNPQGIRKYMEPNAMASLYTTAYDYALFVKGVMNGAELSKEIHDEFLESQIEVDKKSGLSWSLGFGVQEDQNGKAIWQWGDYGIFRNYVIAYPHQKMAMVYLSNSFNGLGIFNELSENIIGGQVLGVDYLGYGKYNTPMGQFCWSVMDNGVKVIESQLPKLRAKHPKEFNSESIGWLGGEFIVVERFDEGIALFKSNLKNNPTSTNANTQLARAYLEKGNIEKAKYYYQNADELGKDNKKFDRKPIEWAMSYIKTLQKPFALESDYLKALAGTYEDRNFELINNQLYYARGSKESSRFKKLIPLSKDIFILEGTLGFRMRFEFTGDGKPGKVVGLYESGYRDESVRDNE